MSEVKGTSGISNEDQEKDQNQKVENQEITTSDDSKESTENVSDENKSEEEVAPAGSEIESEAEDEHHDEHEDDDEELPDYSEYSKEQLVEAIKEISHSDNFKKADRILNEIRPVFDEMHAKEKELALQKFIEEGGEEGDFSMKHDELTDRFEANYQLYKDRKRKHYKEQERQRTENLKKKEELLDRLRELVDGTEQISNLNLIKEIQKEWKEVGPVASVHNKTLWANYNALLDRYYDQRNIDFELKELDRKKNLKAKLILCEKAEELAGSEDVPTAIRSLNDLHEEFKHIGPVPKEEQEPLWQRFKAASDAIYEKRKEFVKHLKIEQQENLSVKMALIEELKPFLTFDSDRIKEWNQKTKDILEVQKKWESAGRVPKENAKELNKEFWSSFKQFFANKQAFFKRLDAMREGNLEKKIQLAEQAEALQESTEWNKTAEKLKQLQRQWKEIGPVPEKQREEVYKRFKKACDTFFENKRAGSKDAEKEYESNLKAKKDIIEQIKQLEAGDVEQLEAYEEAFSKIGFVPRNAIQSIKEEFTNAVNDFIERSEDMLTDEQQSKVKLMAQITKIISGPNADRKLSQKENAIRKKISELQNEIVNWKTNLEFFASSKTADKLKKDFDDKIDEAEKEISLLKKQLRILRNVE